MKIAVIIIGILLILLFLVYIMKLTVKIDYWYQNHQDTLVIKITTLFGLFHKKWTIPVIKASKNDESIVVKEDKPDRKQVKKRISIQKIFSGIQEMGNFLYEAKGSITSFFRKVNIHEFVWNSHFSMQDAASTGKLTAVFWTMKGIVQAVLFQFFTVHSIPRLMVVPNFTNNRNSFELDFHCIISFRLGNAIFTAIKLFLLWRRMHKSSISPSLRMTT